MQNRKHSVVSVQCPFWYTKKQIPKRSCLYDWNVIHAGPTPSPSPLWHCNAIAIAKQKHTYIFVHKVTEDNVVFYLPRKFDCGKRVVRDGRMKQWYRNCQLVKTLSTAIAKHNDKAQVPSAGKKGGAAVCFMYRMSDFYARLACMTMTVWPLA